MTPDTVRRTCREHHGIAAAPLGCLLPGGRRFTFAFDQRAMRLLMIEKSARSPIEMFPSSLRDELMRLHTADTGGWLVHVTASELRLSR